MIGCPPSVYAPLPHHEPAALLSPVVEYYRYRYGRDRGGAVDGLCARTDTALPGATCVFLE